LLLYLIPLVHTKCLVLRGGLVGLLMLTMLGSQRGGWAFPYLVFAETLDFRRL